MGIIPSSMGARSQITRGLGKPQALRTSPHGAGRVMSRNGRARRSPSSSTEQQRAALGGVEARTDADWIDKRPAACKLIDAVMAAQTCVGLDRALAGEQGGCAEMDIGGEVVMVAVDRVAVEARTAVGEAERRPARRGRARTSASGCARHSLQPSWA
jgi:hypothetical protein